MEKRKSEVKKFSDLKGIWKDKVEFSCNDIRDAQLSLSSKLNENYRNCMVTKGGS